MFSSKSRNVRRKKFSFRRWLVRVSLGLVALLGIVLVVGYLFRDRLTAELKLALDDRLNQRGIHADYSASKISPFRGITLSDVRIYKSSARQEAAISLSRARLRFDVWRMLKRPDTASVILVIRDSTLTLRGDDGDHVFADLETDLHLDREGMILEDLRTQYRDIKLDVAGEMEWFALSEKKDPEKKAPRKASAVEKETPPSDRVLDLSPVLEWLDYVPDTPDGEAKLALTFSRTAAKDFFAIEGQLAGEVVNWGDLKAREVNLEFSLNQTKAGTLQLQFPSAGLKIGEGEVRAAGFWNLAEKQVHFSSLESSLNPAALAPAFPPELASSLPDLPPYQFTATGRLDLGDVLSSDLNGQLTSSTPFALPFPAEKPINLAGVSTVFRFKDRTMNLSGLKVKAGPEASLDLSGDVAVQFAPLSTTTAETLISFRQLTLERAGQQLATEGDFSLPGKILNLAALKSNLDLSGLMTDLGFGDPLGSYLQFAASPADMMLEASGQVDLNDPLASQLSGRLAIPEPFVLLIPNAQPLRIASLAAPFDWRDRLLRLNSLEAQAGASGSLAIAGEFDIAFANPAAATAEKPEIGTLITFHQLSLTRNGKNLAAKGILALPGKVLTLASLESNLDLPGTLTDLGFPDPISAHARFPSPPTITLQGTLPLADALSGELTGTLNAPEGVLIPAGENRIAEMKEISTEFALKEKRLTLAGFSAKAFDGELALNAGLDFAVQPIPVGGDLSIAGMNFEAIDRFFDSDSERTGKLSGKFLGSGSADIATLNGEGSIEISEAKFATVPVFRKLKPLIAAITLGGIGEDAQGATVTSTFAIRDGVMNSDDINLKGAFYQVNSAVALDFPRRTLAASGYVTTGGATKVITGLVGKALEVEASGSFDDFDWKLKNAPGLGTVSDLAGLSGDLISKTLGAAASGQIPGAVISTVKDTLTGGSPVRDTAGVAKGTLKGATDIGKSLLGIGRKKEASEPAPKTTETEPEPVPPVSPTVPNPAETPNP